MSGFVLWSGRSQFDDSPITVVVTHGSKNRKTGPMDQAWILRSDHHPLAAARSGADSAICGDCRHRGDGEHRSCYVTVQHGPAGVYRALKRNTYPFLPDDLAAVRMRRRFLRVGAYGDPAAVPAGVWLRLLPVLAGWTGYTHFWRRDQGLKVFLMASVDTEAEKVEAEEMGWRTFRVRQGELLPGEVVCPASIEGRHRLVCQQCRICAGLAGRGESSVAIFPHGPKTTFYRSAQHALFDRSRP